MGDPGTADGNCGRRILLVLEDETLTELLSEALGDAGHRTEVAEGTERLDAALAAGGFDAAIVDLDTRARDGIAAVERIRECAPSTTVIALLPCGGFAPPAPPVHYHLAIEKPARLRAILSAIAVAHRLCAGG